MNNVNKLMLDASELPETMLRIASPPQQLYAQGTSLAELLARPRVAIVGSRKVSTYGREITTQLARELAERGIVIVSGLALGVDSLAHRAALEAGGTTVAVLPSPLERIYPPSHAQLARQILDCGGTLISEYAAGSDTYKTNFIARNRLIAALSQAVIITEAALKSGSLHTARFALEQGRELLAVPGSILSPTSVGTNNLIKAGAAPVTSYEDVLHALGIDEKRPKRKAPKGDTPAEQTMLNLIFEGTHDGDTLLAASGLAVSEFNQALTMLEITGSIRALGGGQWALR